VGEIRPDRREDTSELIERELSATVVDEGANHVTEDDHGQALDLHPPEEDGRGAVERLIKLGEKRDRSVSYLVVQAFWTT